MNAADRKRFWSYVEIRDRESCWPYNGGRDKDGYGKFEYEGRTRPAHRIAYEELKGPIPDGLFIMHSCDNPPCCNPAHHTPGTNRENMIDASRKGRLGTDKTRALANLEISFSAPAGVGDSEEGPPSPRPAHDPPLEPYVYEWQDLYDSGYRICGSGLCLQLAVKLLYPEDPHQPARCHGCGAYLPNGGYRALLRRTDDTEPSE